ncbi:MAG: hypothetical protein NC432_16065 [Roseburia sp.]|nr:hypothetical protein [Roseburia sp.]MCM1097574.1 hypothetical protein [Ruminococcus flavefaciens]
MDRKKQEQALRMMSALSGVDEELLERCGQTEERRKIFRFASLCAACLCAALVGAAVRKGFQSGENAAGGLQNSTALTENGGYEKDTAVSKNESGDGYEGALEEWLEGGGYERALEDWSENGGYGESVAGTSEDQLEREREQEGAAATSEIWTESEKQSGTAVGIRGAAEPDWIDVAELRERTEAGVPEFASETGRLDGIRQEAEENVSGTPSAGDGTGESASSEGSSGTAAKGDGTGESAHGEGLSGEAAAEAAVGGAAPADGISGTAALENTSKRELSAKMPQEEWRAVCVQSGLEEYVPWELPEGYSQQEALGRTGEGGEENLLLCWCDGERMLWLNLRRTDLRPEAEYVWDFPIFNGEGGWQGELPEPGEDGGRRFAVLYGDGVLVEYVGWLAEDEIRELFDQIDHPQD